MNTLIVEESGYTVQWEIFTGSNFSEEDFTDGPSRAAAPTLPVGSTSYCMQPKSHEMARELHIMEAIVHVCPVATKFGVLLK